MINLENGIIEISKDWVVKPGYTFDEFKNCQYYNNQDGICVIDLNEKVFIENR